MVIRAALTTNLFDRFHLKTFTFQRKNIVFIYIFPKFFSSLKLKMELNFEDKKKRLFDCLESAEKNVLAGTHLEQKDEVKLSDISVNSKYSAKKAKLEVVSVRKHKESIFKRPELPIEKCLPVRKRPDYQLHPNKWKKYSLEDVDTSDQTNKQAAFAFLREIEDRKHALESGEADEDTEKPTKIKFNRSVKLRNKRESAEAEEQHDSKKISGNKFVMPEFNFGQKPKKDKDRTRISKVSSSNTAKDKQMKLDHLFEEEDEEEDEI